MVWIWGFVREGCCHTGVFISRSGAQSWASFWWASFFDLAPPYYRVHVTRAHVLWCSFACSRARGVWCGRLILRTALLGSLACELVVRGFCCGGRPERGGMDLGVRS